jgi:membrane fusion protein (multidrug efflux system)
MNTTWAKEPKHEPAAQNWRPPARLPDRGSRVKRFIAGSIFIAVGAALAALIFVTIRHMIATDPGKARRLHASIPVETVAVRRQLLDEVIGGSGVVEQSGTVQLTTILTARVLDVPVKIGDVVKKGDLLIRWDDRLIRANCEAGRQAVESGTIKVRDMERQLARYTALENKKMGTPLDVEKAEIALADARDALAKAKLDFEQAKIDLENVEMRVPLDCIVLERLVNPAETTHKDQLVMRLGTLDPVLMAPKVTEEKVHSVQIGLPAETSFPAFPGEVFEGKVVKVDPNIDPITRTFTTYVELKNPDLRLRPGLSGFARIRRRAEGSLAVPSIALINPTGDQASVFVVDGDGQAHLRKVRPGIVANAMTEILDGLKEGEQVVTVGQLNLRDNDKVHTTARSTKS